MSPSIGIENYYVPEVSRPPTNPSLWCNLFGCKLGERVLVYKSNDFLNMEHAYYECSRCGERHGVATGSLTFRGDLASLSK